jgi:hypothetical protein
MISAILFVDFLRYVTIVLATVVCALLPAAIGVKDRPKRVWFLMVCIEGLSFSAILTMGRHLGEPFAWTKTPVIFLASVAGLAYMIDSLRSCNRNKRSDL